MSELRKKYIEALKNACNEVRLDYFPQVEASELLYKVITLEDIYLPLNLESVFSNLLTSKLRNLEIDELIRLIDKKIEELEEEERREKGIITPDKNDGKAGEHENDHKEVTGTSEVSGDEGSITGKDNNGIRVLIEGNPGSGKTTFCKRLILAVINDDTDFFEKYESENKLYIKRGSVPVLAGCKGIADMSVKELERFDFIQLLYRLCVTGFGKHFSGVTEEDFTQLISGAGSDLTIVLDGWDEILDNEKEDIFTEKINVFLKKYPQTDTVISIRSTYTAPALASSYSDRYLIKSLSDADIRIFCQKWFEILIDPGKKRAKDYSYVTEQILGSQDPQIKQMMKNPLDLSLLLTVSKNDARLPENKAELFKELVDLYIFWSQIKVAGQLSSKSVRILLAYIATVFSKNNKLECDHDYLKKTVERALTDLEWAFTDDMSLISVDNIIKELSHTGIFTLTYAGRTYSFSESRYRAHRQTQEYLTAYAIIVQYADEEYNSMSPADIFEDKYEKSFWKEVIIFAALMDNGRVRQDIVKNLIKKATEHPDDNYVYTNLLFDLIVNGADIRLADKHRIYDIVFSEHITDQQIENIILLLNGSNRNTTDFTAYIESGYSDSVKNGEIKYNYAKAVIEATIALKDGRSPFEHAQALMRLDTDEEIICGLQILIIMAWCKYELITNDFTPYYAGYRMPDDWLDLFRKLYKEGRYALYLQRCIKEVIIAEFARFSDFFDDKDLLEASILLDKQKDDPACELILSMAPVFDPAFDFSPDVSAATKGKYLNRLKEEIEKKEYDNIIFTFEICLLLGCFSGNEQEYLAVIDEIYSVPNNYSVGKARYDQLKSALLTGNSDNERLYKEYFDTGDYSSKVTWVSVESDPSHILYSDGTDLFRIDLPKTGLTNEAKSVLTEEIDISVGTLNNLAYLLRRKEIDSFTIRTRDNERSAPEDLLKEGVELMDDFSLINYALSISGIYKNNTGDYNIGKKYLSNIRIYLKKDLMKWTRVKNWWLNLVALDKREYEGLVVLTWLFDLDLIKLEDYTQDELESLSSLLTDLNSDIGDFVVFRDMISEYLRY
ncbi:MAG: hypothetical protein K6G22_12965 [Lachnospiraceae bacterium]|nr:hypothetical protein [Lachnospiraceae bacterium]